MSGAVPKCDRLSGPRRRPSVKGRTCYNSLLYLNTSGRLDRILKGFTIILYDRHYAISYAGMPFEASDT